MKERSALHMNDNQTNTIRKRYNRIAGVFDIMDNMIQETWRKDVTQQAEGKVLESASELVKT